MRPEASLSNNKIIVAIEPGPAINGVARGKTDGSSCTSISVCSSLRCARLLNNISTAVKNNNNPPEILNAGIPMPIKLSKFSPSKPKRSRIPSATEHALSPIFKRFLLLPCVKDIKIGNNPIGSITKKSITNAVTNNSNIVESKEKIT